MRPAHASVMLCLAALLAATAGCGSEAPGASRESAGAAGKPVALANNDWSPGESREEALFEGELAYQDSCTVLLRPGSEPLEIVWPEGWTGVIQDGELLIRREDGSVAARGGDQLAGAGAMLASQGCGSGGAFSLQDDLSD